MHEAGKPEFEISGGALCLDFANTWEDRGRPGTDKLDAYPDLLGFLETVDLLEPAQAETLETRADDRPEAAGRAFAEAVELREAVYRVFSAQAAGEPPEERDLERLNAWLAESSGQLRLERRGSRFVWSWRNLASSFEAPLAAIARSAAELLTGDKLDRVRECDGESCTWLFLDSSRNRSRRWCSMESCGNRAKARRHYRRARRSAATPADRSGDR